ncbi:Ferric reductase transmembrane component 3 [Wickerhamiella sorbophila]|uniref:ferric-chelate reductase (NADPH) n=1 Tax=Wickerhamiella sorbophila TaxID=45607 RepID=A0A2T0FF04_9ASCO|nr:Ferric reductase transmembrane component 3 [Wickerhamiella sorbophila]PRT53547.1 Ferric reductase transmembrane component 3 [Wickerhamiella sorbophila]
MNLFFTYVLALLVGIGSAQKVGVKSPVGFGCWNCAFKWNFTVPFEIGWYDKHCKSDIFLTTALNCVHMYAEKQEDIAYGYSYIRDQCHYWGNRTLNMRELSEIYTQNVKNMIAATEVKPGQPVYNPVAIPRQLFNKELTMANDAKSHYRLGTIFGCSMIAYWALVLLIASIFHYLRLFRPTKNRRTQQTANRIRKYLTLPAVIGDKHHTPYNFLHLFHITAPTRGQALIILLFIVINIISVSICYDLDDSYPMTFASKGDKIARFLANRTGIIAFTNLPVAVLFACRNNPFIVTTGWPYDTFMLFHRWCARMMVIQSIIHGVLMTWAASQENILIFKWNHVHNWRGGNIAAYFMIFMIFFSIRAVRQRAYEIFLSLHRIFFIIVMVCLIVHCSDFGWMGWIWATVVIYFGEHFLRIARTVYSGGLVEAQFSIVSADAFRIRAYGRRNWVIYPGQYAYIRVFDRHIFWQSHPFSVFQAERGKSSNSLELIIKSQNGATKHIYEYLQTQPEGSTTYKILIEGPYGNYSAISTYDSVLVLAGGIGITAMYSYVRAMAATIKDGQRIMLMWVLGCEDLVHAFDEELRRLLEFPRSNVEVTLCLTQRTPPQSGQVEVQGNNASDHSSLRPSDRVQSSSTEDMFDQKNHTSTMTVKEGYSHSEPSEDSEISLEQFIQYGRPQIGETVARFIKTSVGSKAILCCGPSVFVDDTRDSIVSHIQESSMRVDYFEEAFSW